MKTFEQAFKHIKDKEVPWTAHFDELRFIFNYTTYLKPKCIIECATGPGGSLLAMHEGWPTAEIHTMDISEKLLYPPYKDVGWVFKTSRPTDPAKVTLYHGNSSNTQPLLTSPAGHAALLNLDAEHCHPMPLLDLINLLKYCIFAPHVFLQLVDPEYYGNSHEDGGMRLHAALTKLGCFIDRHRNIGLYRVYNEQAFIRRLLLNYDWSSNKFADNWKGEITTNPYENIR